MTCESKPGQSLAGSRTQIEQRNVDIALRLFTQGWGANQGWKEVWREVVSPSVHYCFHGQTPIENLEQAIAFNAELFAGFPTLDVTVERVVAEDDAVVVQAHLKGGHTGPFLGIPASGASVSVPDVTLFRLAGGKVTEMRYFTDLLTVMRTIGAISAS